MEAKILTPPADKPFRCGDCYEPIESYVMVVHDDGEKITVADYLTVPCAHHAPPYFSLDGLPPDAQRVEANR